MVELTQIHSTKSSDAISIVFVHGLGGDARRTWMYTPNDDATLWPKWVGEDANCNVWIVGYLRDRRRAAGAREPPGARSRTSQGCATRRRKKPASAAWCVTSNRAQNVRFRPSRPLSDRQSYSDAYISKRVVTNIGYRYIRAGPLQRLSVAALPRRLRGSDALPKIQPRGKRQDGSLQQAGEQQRHAAHGARFIIACCRKFQTSACSAPMNMRLPRLPEPPKGTRPPPRFWGSVLVSSF